MIKLLHCPFCGSTAEFAIYSVPRKKTNAVAVHCVNCDATSQKLFYEYSEKETLSVTWDKVEKLQKASAEMWNKRYNIKEAE